MSAGQGIDNSIRVPEISTKHDGREVDCEAIVRNGITYYKQRVDATIVLQPEMFNEYAHNHTGLATTLAVALNGDGTEISIEVVNAVGFVVGDDLQISNGATELTFAEIKIITGNVFTLDRRIDNAHPIGSNVEKVSFDMNVLGTLLAPKEYFIKPEGNSSVHVVRVIISMVHSTAGDMALFGNLPRLVNGLLVRARINGIYRTFTVWKDNDELKDDMYDVEFNVRSSGGGSYGTSGRWSFESFGVELRLDGATNDQLEFYVQDNLSTLSHFSIKAQGHYI